MSELPAHPEESGDLYAADISRAYRMAAREEPSPEMDEAIHAAALRAAGSRPRLRARPPLRRWGLPIAIAATIVVGVSVAFLVSDPRDTMISPMAEAPTTQLREAPQAAPPASEDLARKEGAAREPMSAGGTAREARPTRERTTRDEIAARREPQAESAASTAVAPGEAADSPRAAAPAEAPIEGQGVRKAAPSARVQTDQEGEAPSPEVWLQRIREMRSKGEIAQGEESLRAFRRRYPDYPLPADLSTATDGAK
jgi:hypothetical protein